MVAAQNGRREMTKTFRLCDLIAETYVADEPKFFGYADRGNGSSFGENGQVLHYCEGAAAQYGDIPLTACQPIKAEDGRSEFVYASDWIDGRDGYQFRVMF